MSFSVGAPLLRALSFAGKIPQLNYKIEALENLMSAPPLKQTEKGFQGKNHDISFENVHFSYKEDEVLHGVTLDMKSGTMTALVGESGSGKTTLAKLLVHYYDLQSGAIKIGGQDITDMSIEALNNEISYVSQEQFLFNISLYDNIRLGKPDATREEVLKAASRAQCDEFLARLPKGIDTMAGDGGKQLSGGERQRIALARALLKNAPIIVLDEATAFVDPENEEKMNEAIAQIIKNKTVVVIAHRLHSIVNADKICVLKDGNVVAADSHEKLLESCEEYQKLWKAANDSAIWKINTKKEGMKECLQ
jgi:ATP-binding cassette subfamily B protein